MKQDVKSITSFGFETRADVEVKLREVLVKTQKTLISRDMLLILMGIDLPDARSKRPTPEITRIRRMVSQVMDRICLDIGWRNIGSKHIPCWARVRQ